MPLRSRRRVVAGTFAISAKSTPRKRQPLTHRIEEATSVALMLEASHQIIGVAHDDHVASGLVPSPAFSPQIEYVVQVTTVRLKTEQIQLGTDSVFLACVPRFGKCLRHRHFLEKGDGE